MNVGGTLSSDATAPNAYSMRRGRPSTNQTIRPRIIRAVRIIETAFHACNEHSYCQVTTEIEILDAKFGVLGSLILRLDCTILCVDVLIASLQNCSITQSGCVKWGLRQRGLEAANLAN